jgi:hypothetical protein
VKILNQKEFDDLYNHYVNDFTLGENWNSLAEKYGYKSGESLRWEFKAERKRRGIPPKHKQNETAKYVAENDYEQPRVAVLDIETLPAVAYVWGLYDQNLGLEQVTLDSCLLSWAGKFLNESEIFSDILTSKEATEHNDKRIAKSIWDFLSKCDVVIGHNFAGFDHKHINSAFLKYDLLPLKFTVVDTLQVARQNFMFASNKMKFLNEKLGIKQKMENEGFPLWRKCSQGNSDALKTMMEYNIADVPATEDLFYKFRPYIRSFNVALYNTIESKQCPVCGSEDLKEEGFYYTSAGKYRSLRCQKCKCISRAKYNYLDKDKRKSLLVNS